MDSLPLWFVVAVNFISWPTIFVLKLRELRTEGVAS